MPLIELVAARAHEYPLHRIVYDLQDSRLNVLRMKSSAIHTGPERHISVESCLEWTFQLLSIEELGLFLSLSVFTKSFSSEAAAAINTLDDAERLLVSVCNMSLVQLSVKTGRYSLLPVIREYALDKAGSNRKTYYDM